MADLGERCSRIHHSGKENMRNTLKRRFAVMLTLAGVVVGSLAIASPAQAYSDGLWRWVSFNTGNCNTVGGYDYGVSSSSDYCTVDGIRYTKDSGGVALYATFTPNYCCGGTKAFRVEWHPHGEHLKVCDLSNDGDTIYGRLKYKSYNWYWQSRLRPPGTSDSVECSDGNYSYVEGTEVRIYLYDDEAMSEQMAGFYNLYG